jgi:translation initiation factor 3 subunit H
MAASMAATIAASLPAPQAASAPAAPIHEPIPASMSKLIDIEAEIPLDLVQVEGLVCSSHGALLLPGIDCDPAGCF